MEIISSLFVPAGFPPGAMSKERQWYHILKPLGYPQRLLSSLHLAQDPVDDVQSHVDQERLTAEVMTPVNDIYCTSVASGFNCFSPGQKKKTIMKAPFTYMFCSLRHLGSHMIRHVTLRRFSKLPESVFISFGWRKPETEVPFEDW